MKHILKKFILFGMFVMPMSILLSCSSQSYNNVNNSIIERQNLSESGQNNYISVSPEVAKKMMDDSEDYIILDVRTEDEYNDFHIKNSILLPDYDVRRRAKDILVDKAQKIFVYCRTGVRSKLAARTLEDLGYSNVIEFGGIVKWPYEIVE